MNLFYFILSFFYPITGKVFRNAKHNDEHIADKVLKMRYGDTPVFSTLSLVWKGVSPTLWSCRYTLSYPDELSSRLNEVDLCLHSLLNPLFLSAISHSDLTSGGFSSLYKPLYPQWLTSVTLTATRITAIYYLIVLFYSTMLGNTIR